MLMQSLLAAGQSMSRMQTMQSARTQMQGKANILRIESKQDGGNEMKEAKADALEEKSTDLMGNLMDEVTDATETLKPDEEAKTEEKQEDKNAEKNPKRDTVTLSDSAAGYRGPLPAIQPVTGEAETYKADGSKMPDTMPKTTPSFEATA